MKELNNIAIESKYPGHGKKIFDYYFKHGIENPNAYNPDVWSKYDKIFFGVKDGVITYPTEFLIKAQGYTVITLPEDGEKSVRITPKEFIDKIVGVKGFTHTPLTIHREKLYKWLEDYATQVNQPQSDEYRDNVKITTDNSKVNANLLKENEELRGKIEEVEEKIIQAVSALNVHNDFPEYNTDWSLDAGANLKEALSILNPKQDITLTREEVAKFKGVDLNNLGEVKIEE